MSAKNKIVSSKKEALLFVQDLKQAVQEIDRTDKDFCQLVARRDKSILKKLAKVIISEKRPVFQVTVDYNRTLDKMISASHYGLINNSITAENFPVQGQGRLKQTITLFHFDHKMTSENVITEMDSLGYRPAKIEKLLALGEAQPELQKRFPIVCLGSFWLTSDNLHAVPILYWRFFKRDLDLYWFESLWGDLHRFIAVRKFTN